MPRPLVILLALSLLGGCKERRTPEPEREPTSGGPSDWPARDRSAELAVSRSRPFPVEARDGAIGVDGTATVLDAAEDGSWVALCHTQDDESSPWVVIEQGSGLAVDRLLATGPHDLLVVRDRRLVHIDVVARTFRELGATTAAALDGASRRVVHGNGAKVTVIDPGMAPRELPAGEQVASIWLRNPRWAEVGLTDEPPAADPTSSCEPFVPPAAERSTTLDLDPSGVEALDRIGPTLGITPSGEVTLDGEVVIDADCGANVIAALATPARVLAICQNGPNRLAGPGVRKLVGEYIDNTLTPDASISPHLRLGTRLVCFRLNCVDLLTGNAYKVRDDLVFADEQMVVRKDGSSLRIDTLAADATAAAPPQRTVALPRIVRAVTVDTVTGKRNTGTAPVPAAFIDRAGRWLLYGRYIIDLQDAVLVTTLVEDAFAIDLTGRVLISASPGTGPYRWIKP